MIILDAQGDPVGRGAGTLPLASGWAYANETPELLALLPAASDVPVENPTVERSPLYVRRWFRAQGREAQYDTLLSMLTGTAAADYRDAVAFSWDDAAIVGIRQSPQALALLGMTESELRTCFEE